MNEQNLDASFVVELLLHRRRRCDRQIVLRQLHVRPAVPVSPPWHAPAYGGAERSPVGVEQRARAVAVTAAAAVAEPCVEAEQVAMSPAHG
jgi:hypothetical protein